MLTILKRSVGLVCIFLHASVYGFDHYQNATVPGGVHTITLPSASGASGVGEGQGNLQDHEKGLPGDGLGQENVYALDRLMAAAKEGDVETVRRLVNEYDLDVNQSDQYGRTALHFAALRGHEGVARLLLELGADVNQSDQYGRTALDFAAFQGHEGVARLLLESGADVNGEGQGNLQDHEKT
jgi:hypothetical protein